MHDHHHGASSSEGQQRRLTLALILAASYMLAEVAGGLWTGSLALLADAGHMLSDVFALSLSVFAFRLARRPATPQQTYGHHRTEILAALLHGLLLVGVSVYILSEAFERIETPREILGAPMLAIAISALNQVGIGAYQVASQTRPVSKPASQFCQVSLRTTISTSAETKTENVATNVKNSAFWTHMGSTAPSTRPFTPCRIFRTAM